MESIICQFALYSIRSINNAVKSVDLRSINAKKKSRDHKNPMWISSDPLGDPPDSERFRGFMIEKFVTPRIGDGSEDGDLKVTIL